MIVSPGYGVTVTWLKRGTPTVQDTHGRDVPPWTEQDLHGCVVAPRATFEDVQGRDLVIEGFTLYAADPVARQMGAADRIRYGGQLFEIDGPPQDWYSALTGVHAGVQASISRITG